MYYVLISNSKPDDSDKWGSYIARNLKDVIERFPEYKAPKGFEVHPDKKSLWLKNGEWTLIANKIEFVKPNICNHKLIIEDAGVDKYYATDCGQEFDIYEYEEFKETEPEYCPWCGCELR